MSDVKEQAHTSYDALKERFGYTNRLAAPRLAKVVVSVGTGKHSRTEKGKNEFVAQRLAAITGQKAAPRPAKKSIASFKLREGDIIGQAVTLRGRRMYDFLDRFLNIAAPRMRDFRGFSRASVDRMGNMTIGAREHNIFPETSDEELKDVFGFAVTIVTTARTREEAVAFLEKIGVPFKKEDGR